MVAIGTDPSIQNYFPRITDTSFMVSYLTFVDSVDFIIERTERYFEFPPLVVEVVSYAFTIGSFRVFVVTINCRKCRFVLGFGLSHRCFDTMEFAFLATTFSTHLQSSVPSCARCTHRACTSE